MSSIAVFAFLTLAALVVALLFAGAMAKGNASAEMEMNAIRFEEMEVEKSLMNSSLVMERFERGEAEDWHKHAVENPDEVAAMVDM
ncbi:unnamed protein product [Rhodiola kirilowii]